MKNPFESLENSIFTTKLKEFLAWGRKNSLWPYPFGTACCGIEYMAVVGPKYDISRFGAEVVRFSPRQSDLLIVAGTITEKMAPVIKKIYDQMADPKWVIAMGACASSGGFYRAYHVLQGVDRIIPVDVYIAGCPPTPEAVIAGLMMLRTRSLPKRSHLKLNWVRRKLRVANLLYINVAGDHPLPGRDVLKIAAQSAQIHAVADEAAAMRVLDTSTELTAVVANAPLHSIFTKVRQKFPKARTVLVTAHPMKVYSAGLNNEEEMLLDHVIANRSASEWTVNELRITLQKIITADVFGIEKYLTIGAKTFSRTVTNSEQREELNSEVMRFAEECRLGTHVSKMIFGISEELLMNAIYDAPVAAGKRFIEDLPRTTPMILQPDEFATLKFGCDGYVFAIGISDPFGKLSQQKLGQYVKKVLQRRDSATLIDTKKGGAGLGLFKILYSCHSLVCNVKPDAQTEIISLIDVTEQLRDFAKMARSIHYFNAQ